MQCIVYEGPWILFSFKPGSPTFYDAGTSLMSVVIALLPRLQYNIMGTKHVRQCFFIGLATFMGSDEYVYFI